MLRFKQLQETKPLMMKLETESLDQHPKTVAFAPQPNVFA